MSEIPKIKLTGVKKSFGDKHVLRGLDLAVNKAESVVVIGGSGTGKSVTLKCILGILHPDAGMIQVDGEETAKLHGRARDKHLAKFGMLFQGSALFDSLPVWRNVAFKLIQALHVPKKEARDRAMATLASVGLSADVGELYPAELSGGMQKRVAIARALVIEPQLILYDEPTAELDPVMAVAIGEEILNLRNRLKATSIVVTHDRDLAFGVADRIAMIMGGQILFVGTPEELKKHTDPKIRNFIYAELLIRRYQSHERIT
jgi:phospholipid/cholesterol/gamma-HCH transport system ATP-binding protein